MLFLTTKPGDSLWIELGDIDPGTPVGEVFARGPIEVLVAVVKEGQVRLGVEADCRLLVRRSGRPKTCS